MCFLRQSTSVVVRVGSFVDASDGVTPETGITLGVADQAELLKAGGGASVDISGNTWAAVTGAGGWYDLTLTTGNTDTVGDLTVVIQDSSICLPVFARFHVLEEAVYDQLFAASAPGAATPTAVANVQADTDDIQARLPASLSGGRMRAQVEGMDAGTVTAAATAADFSTEAAADTQTGLTAQGYTAGRAPNLDNLDATVSSRATAAALAAVAADVTTLLSRVTATLFSGITSLAQWLGLMAGKQVGDATARTEIRATGAGSGTFDETTDALEAVRDRGDAAWTTATGFATSAEVAAVQADTDDLQTRLPASLVGGRMRSHVEAIDAGVVTTIQSGLATATAVAAVDAAIAALNDVSTADLAAAIASDPGVLKILHRVCNRVDLNPANGTLTVYDDAGVVEFTALAYMDVAQTLLYDGTAPVHSIQRLT